MLTHPSTPTSPTETIIGVDVALRFPPLFQPSGEHAFRKPHWGLRQGETTLERSSFRPKDPTKEPNKDELVLLVSRQS